MFGFKSKKSRQRFYLLPGQGGRSYFRKQRVFLSWAAAVAVVFSLALAALMWWLSRPKL